MPRMLVVFAVLSIAACSGSTNTTAPLPDVDPGTTATWLAWDEPVCRTAPDLSLDMGIPSEPWEPVDEFDVIAIISDEHDADANLVLRMRSEG